MANVTHITTVHSPLDNRIFFKQCRSLAEFGHTVHLVVPHDRDEVVDGVQVCAIPIPSSRWSRLLFTGWQAVRRAWRTGAEIYHFHDPELAPWCLGLRLTGKNVVYDVHEDYFTSVASTKNYLGPFRHYLAHVVSLMERTIARAFEVVVAEKYYLRKFPDALPILNYPIVDSKADDATVGDIGQATSPRRLIYTGGIHSLRGAVEHAGIVRSMSDVEVHFVGRAAPGAARAIREAAGDGWDRVVMDANDAYISPSRIKAAYDRGGWLAGLAVFPPDPHFVEKELTKFFEYMLAGIPVICSRFPVWERLIEGNGCGICVDPGNPQELVDAVIRLRDDPQLARQMADNGRRVVRESLNWHSQAAELDALYARLSAN